MQSNKEKRQVKHYLTFKEKLVVLYVCLKRKIILSLRFKISALFSLIGSIVGLATFFFLGILVQPGVAPYISQYGSGDFFVYVLLGMAFMSFANLALSLYYNVISSTYWSNWLEMIFSSPMKFSTYMGITTVWVYFASAVNILLFLSIGVFIFGANLSVPGTVWLVIPVLLLAITAISGFGLMSASMFLLADVKGDIEPINWAIGTGAGLLSGAIFPPEILPKPLHLMSRLLPHTYALDAFRRIMLNGEGLSSCYIQTDIFRLIIFCMIILPVGAYMFSKGLKKAEKTGKLARWG